MEFFSPLSTVESIVGCDCLGALFLVVKPELEGFVRVRAAHFNDVSFDTIRGSCRHIQEAAFGSASVDSIYEHRHRIEDHEIAQSRANLEILCVWS